MFIVYSPMVDAISPAFRFQDMRIVSLVFYSKRCTSLGITSPGYKSNLLSIRPKEAGVERMISLPVRDALLPD